MLVAAATRPAPPSPQVTDPGLLKWKDKVALVTGASSGIGWAICELLALQGGWGAGLSFWGMRVRMCMCVCV